MSSSEQGREEKFKIGGLGKNQILMVVAVILIAIGVYNHWFSSAAYMKDGDDFFSKHKYQEAASAYTKAIEKNPQNHKLYLKRAAAYEEYSKGKAIDDYSKALELDPNNVQTYIKRAKAYAKQDHFDDAIKDYVKAIELDPQLVDSYIERANLYLNAKNYEGALADSNKALKINPKSASAYNIRGLIRKAQGDYGNAASDFKQAIQFASTDEASPYYFNLGDICRLLVDHENAVANAMNTKKPASTFSSYGNRCFNEKNYSEAVFYYTKSLEQKDNKEVRVDRGDAYRYAGNYADALVDYTRAINSMEDYFKLPFSDKEDAIQIPNEQKAAAYFGRGYIYQAQQDLVSAIENYTKAIELNSGPGAYNNRGNCYSDQGDISQAISDYTKAIELKPKDALYYNNRGRAHRKMGNTAQAEADFAKAKELEEK